MNYRLENIKSCFLGLAIGDAMGVPVEFRPRSYLSVYPVTEMLAYGTWNQPTGTWSDDSSLTFCLAESLLSGYDLNDIGKKFVSWCLEGHWGAHHKVFDIGMTTQMAIGRLAKGEDARYAGNLDIDSNGNGSLMRITPASLYFANVVQDDLFLRMTEVSSITHGHFRSIFSCFLFSVFMAELFRGKDKISSLRSLQETASEFARRRQLNENEVKLFERITSGEIRHATEDSIQSSGYVLHTLEAALWCFLTTDTYSAAILKAVNLGEDTDTTASVTGAMAGLYYGIDAIPPRWIEQLARANDIIKLSETFSNSMKSRILQGKA